MTDGTIGTLSAENARLRSRIAGLEAAMSTRSQFDIAAHLAAEEELRRRTAELDLLYRAGREMGRSLDLVTIYRTLRSFASEPIPCNSLVGLSYRAGEPIVCRNFRLDGTELAVEELPPIPLEPPGRGTQSQVTHKMLEALAAQLAYAQGNAILYVRATPLPGEGSLE